MIRHLEQLDKNIRHKIFVPTYRKNSIVKIQNEDIVISKCFQKWERFFYYHKQKKIFDACVREIDMAQINFIHAYTVFTDGNIAFKIHEEFQIPYIVTVRATDINVFFKYRSYLKKRGVEILKNAKKIVFLSESYKKQLLNLYVDKKVRDVLGRKSCIIPNGIEDFWHKNLYTEKRRPPDRDCLNLFYAGVLDGYKNIEASLKTIEILKQRGFRVHFTVAGRVVKEKLHQLVEKQPETDYVGEKTKEELLELFRENDIFIMPSHSETFGLVYAEALSQSMPVIYSAGQGFDEQFPVGMVGYAVDRFQPEKIADAVEQIIKEYGRISANALECVKIFNWEEIVGYYIEFYVKYK